MSDAAKEIETINGASDTTIFDTSVSNGGAWKRRSLALMNGNTAPIFLESGRIVDTEPMSPYCLKCTLNYKFKATDILKYETFLARHENSCMAKHKGSAGAMEIIGTKRIFKRSVEKHGLRYVKFLGDGDSKSFPAVEDIYEGMKVEQLECIGHVQKWAGIRLRNLKMNVKGLGGRGRLTDNIYKLQNCYEIAIRRNSGDLNATKSATAASLFHVASSATNDYHTHCPSGSDSWCLIKADKANNTSSYKRGPGLPLDIIKVVKSICQELCSESLLKKCTHGQT